MTSFFQISQSEALLLGKCFGAYEKTRLLNPKSHFLFFFREHVLPFVPQNASITFKQLTPNIIPDNITWHDIEMAHPDEKLDAVGLLPTAPNTYFQRKGEKYYQITKRDDIRFLSHHIVDLLEANLVRRTTRDMAEFPPSDSVDNWGKLQVRLLQDPYGSVVTDSTTIENSTNIHEKLAALVGQPHNSHTDTFKLGKLLGELVYLGGCAIRNAWQDVYNLDDCDNETEVLSMMFEDTFGTDLSIPGSTLSDEIQSCIYRMLEHKSFPSGLAHRWPILATEPEHVGNFFGPLASNLHNAYRVREAASFTLGELLASLDQHDNQTLTFDKRHLSPRVLRLRKNSNPADVRNTIEWLKSLYFSEDLSPSPAETIRSLSHAIEILSKQNWPSWFSGRYEPRLAELLRSKLDSKNEVEKRFANNALSLYKAYRNPSQHSESFECTHTEAFHFLTGIQVLCELNEKICKEGSTGS